MVSIFTSGVADYLQKKWLSREFHDRSFTEADSIGVTIGHVRGLLVVFGLSVAAAAGVMLAEVAVHRLRTAANRPTGTRQRRRYGGRAVWLGRLRERSDGVRRPERNGRFEINERHVRT